MQDLISRLQALAPIQEQTFILSQTQPTLPIEYEDIMEEEVEQIIPPPPRSEY